MNEAEWLASSDVVRMLRSLRPGYGDVGLVIPGRVGEIAYRISDRKLRLFATACCRQPEVWERLTDDSPCWRCSSRPAALRDAGDRECIDCGGTGRINRSRRAVEVAERYADEGESVARQMGREWLWLDMESDHFHGWLAVYVACNPPDTLTRVTREHNDGISRLVSPASQAALLRCIVGNPFRPVVLPASQVQCLYCCGNGHVRDSTIYAYAYRWDRVECGWCNGVGKVAGPCPWLTHNDGAVPKIARAIYDGRRWEEMPILADALTDAGCDVEDMLRHCRGQERCWLCVRVNSDPSKGACSVCGQAHNGGPAFRPYSTGWIPRRGPHVRGDWVLDLMLGNG